MSRSHPARWDDYFLNPSSGVLIFFFLLLLASPFVQYLGRTGNNEISLTVVRRSIQTDRSFPSNTCYLIYDPLLPFLYQSFSPLLTPPRSSPGVKSRDPSPAYVNRKKQLMNEEYEQRRQEETLRILQETREPYKYSMCPSGKGLLGREIWSMQRTAWRAISP
jgi:hypothetical protein